MRDVNSADVVTTCPKSQSEGLVHDSSLFTTSLSHSHLS